MANQHRIVKQGGCIGSHPSENFNSKGWYHGELFVVQRLSDEGSASAWNFVAAFASHVAASDFIDKSA